jgi:hypothetical protein
MPGLRGKSPFSKAAWKHLRTARSMARFFTYLALESRSVL